MNKAWTAYKFSSFPGVYFWSDPLGGMSKICLCAPVKYRNFSCVCFIPKWYRANGKIFRSQFWQIYHSPYSYKCNIVRQTTSQHVNVHFGEGEIRFLLLELLSMQSNVLKISDYLLSFKSARGILNSHLIQGFGFSGFRFRPSRRNWF